MIIVELNVVKPEINQEIVQKLLDAAEMASKDEYTGIALCLIRADGTSYVSTFGRGSRLQLLGVVADLQYTLAKDGDKP